MLRILQDHPVILRQLARDVSQRVSPEREHHWKVIAVDDDGSDVHVRRAYRSSARSSSALLMVDRPLMPRSFASLRSGSYVRPPEPLRERRPPRRPDEMSSIDVRLASLASPARARSLLTVRAAISSARSSGCPRSSGPSLMCSYCRSRLGDHALTGIAEFPFLLTAAGTRKRMEPLYRSCQIP